MKIFREYDIVKDNRGFKWEVAKDWNGDGSICTRQYQHSVGEYWRFFSPEEITIFERRSGLRIGDKVQLNTGGPIMTLVREWHTQCYDSVRYYDFVWFDNDFNMQSTSLPANPQAFRLIED